MALTLRELGLGGTNEFATPFAPWAGGAEIMQAKEDRKASRERRKVLAAQATADATSAKAAREEEARLAVARDELKAQQRAATSEFDRFLSRFRKLYKEASELLDQFEFELPDAALLRQDLVSMGEAVSSISLELSSARAESFDVERIQDNISDLGVGTSVMKEAVRRVESIHEKVTEGANAVRARQEAFVALQREQEVLQQRQQRLDRLAEIEAQARAAKFTADQRRVSEEEERDARLKAIREVSRINGEVRRLRLQFVRELAQLNELLRKAGAPTLAEKELL